MSRVIEVDALLYKMYSRMKSLRTEASSDYTDGFEEGLVTVCETETIDAVQVTRCAECVSHKICTIEEYFKLIKAENPFCCLGDKKEAVKG